ncbi:hypothetical protein KCU88_g2487, partial [Aureobasidium melanogenum]
MAPLRGLPSRAAQPRKSILKSKSTSSGTAGPAEESLFPSSKKDKRRIKHAMLMDRVTKSSAKKPAKRRRPNKKLVTTLDALADALPTEFDGDGDGNNGDANANTQHAGDRPQDQVNIIKRKSMKSRPGAMKRKEKLDKGERDRFAKNLAQLVAAAPKPVTTGETNAKRGDGDSDSDPKPTATVASTSDRWAALRGFISQTLETRPDVKNVTTK